MAASPYLSILVNGIAAISAVGALVAVGWQTKAYRISSERQLRAYIVPEFGNICNVADVDPDIEGLKQDARVVNPAIGPVATIHIRNTGETPSFDVKHSANIHHTHYPLAGKITPLVVSEPSITILGPNVGAELSIHLPSRLAPLDIENLKAGYGIIYVEGVIEYTDIFKHSHTTHYRLQHHSSTGKIGSGMKLVFSPEGNYGD